MSAKALTIICREAKLHTGGTDAVIVRGGVRKLSSDKGIARSINRYMISNRRTEIEGFSGLQAQTWSGWGLDIGDLKMLPYEHEITEDSVAEVWAIGRHEAAYFRALWTHNFTGVRSESNFAVAIDGGVVGVFSYSKDWISQQGSFGHTENALLVMNSISRPDKKWRLGRLLVILSKLKDVAEFACDPHELAQIDVIKTAMMTPHPESKQMRGLMKLQKRVKHPIHGFSLTYTSEMKEQTCQEAFREWLVAEKKYAQRRERKALTA